MTDEKWTLIDKKTQIASWLIIILGLIVVLTFVVVFPVPIFILIVMGMTGIFLMYYGGTRIELRNETKKNIKKIKLIIDIKIAVLSIIFSISLIGFNYVNSLNSYDSFSLIYSIITIIYFLIIMNFLILLCFIGRRLEIRKQTLKKFKEIKMKIDIKTIISFFILVILIFSISYIYNYKPYQGLSIEEVRDNYQKYDNGDFEDYIYAHIDYDNVDTSMLMRGNEYFFTGIFRRELVTSEFTYEGETYYSSGYSTYFDVTKIKPFYDDVERHNTSRFIGTWKLIENYYGPYADNWTWVLYENNTLRYLEDGDNLYDRFVVDGNRFYHEYYEASTVIDDWISSDHYYSKYYFSENDTKLRLESEDGRLIKVFQKIEI